MRASLGKAGSRWELTLTPPEGKAKAVRFADLPCDPAWQEARWVGFSSVSPGRQSFYLDDLVMENR
jgi:hypothetical protein